MKTVTFTVEEIVSAVERKSDGYEDFLSGIRRKFALEQGPLFTTNVGDLWGTFLNGLPQKAQQHYTCTACRHFVERFGGLVRIAEDGTKTSAIWREDVPPFFAQAVKAMLRAISKARVNGVFISSLAVYGQPVTGEWHHMAVTPPVTQVWRGMTQAANQRAAEKSEEFKMLITGLQEFRLDVVEQALKLLRSEALYRSEKVIGPAEWLRKLHISRAATKNAAARENITWLAVATSPAGFCHVKSTMIGTLLEDIASDMDFDAVSRRFAAKMHPLQYQRPQAAPTAGNIAQAEKIMEQLGAAGSLDRRFARLEELTTLWKPFPKREEAPDKGGVFAHLTAKNGKQAPPSVDAPAQIMTWEKFCKTVLPGAHSIEYRAANIPNTYSAITTATNDNAPPILQWDSEQERNPFAWYLYNGGSSPKDWNLTPGWCKVTAVCLSPSMWQDGFDHQGKAVHFILEGAKDTRYKSSGNAIFPETLKNEFHGIRSTIEAYSGRAVLGGYDEASACGIRATDKSWNITLRVTSELGVSSYRLDRWD